MNLICKKTGKGSNYFLTEAGKIIKEFDPTIEEEGTWFYIHYKLSVNLDIWKWYITKFDFSKFNKSRMLDSLTEHFPNEKSRTREDGLNSLISTMRNESVPLGSDFGYFIENDSVFYKKEPPEEMLSPVIFAYAVLDWMKRNNRIDVHTSELFKPGAPARIFNISGDRGFKIHLLHS